MDPHNLKNMDVLKVIVPLIVLVLGIVFFTSGNTVLGLVLLVPVVIFFIYAFIKLPWQEIGRAEYEKEEKQKQTLLGNVWVQFKHVLDYLSLLYGAILILGLLFMAYKV